jgi:hypothetical protein
VRRDCPRVAHARVLYLRFVCYFGGSAKRFSNLMKKKNPNYVGTNGFQRPELNHFACPCTLLVEFDPPRNKAYRFRVSTDRHSHAAGVVFNSLIMLRDPSLRFCL